MMPENAPASGTADPLGLHGVVPPSITGFHEDGSLDPQIAAAHARFLVDQGVHGIFPLGTNGEFPLLTADERERVVSAVVEAVGGDVPVIAGVGAPDTRSTVENANRAVAAGADGVVVVTPFYYPLDREAAVRHYSRVAEAVDRAVYAYHIPRRTGNELSLSTLSDLADHVVGFKDSSKDVPWLGQAVDAHPELTVLAGSDSLLFAGLAVGCAGLVSAVANAFPDLVVSLYRAYDDGREDRARELQSRAYRVRRALKRGPYLAGIKEALSLRDVGFDPGPLRSPLRRMDPDDRAALRRELTDIGAL